MRRPARDITIRYSRHFRLPGHLISSYKSVDWATIVRSLICPSGDKRAPFRIAWRRPRRTAQDARERRGRGAGSRGAESLPLDAQIAFVLAIDVSAADTAGGARMRTLGRRLDGVESALTRRPHFGHPRASNLRISSFGSSLVKGLPTSALSVPGRPDSASVHSSIKWQTGGKRRVLGASDEWLKRALPESLALVPRAGLEPARRD